MAVNGSDIFSEDVDVMEVLGRPTGNTGYLGGGTAFNNAVAESISDIVDRVQEQERSVTDFGMVAGTGLTQAQRKANLQAAQTALDSVLENGQSLVWPVGTYEVEWDPTDDLHTVDSGGTKITGLYIPGGKTLTMYGQGMEKTIISVFPKTITVPHNFIYIDSYATRASAFISDMRIDGPTVNDNNDDDVPSSGIWHQNTQVNSTTDTLIIRRLKMTGEWSYGIVSQHGVGTFEIHDSDIESQGTGLSIFNQQTVGGGHKTAVVENCYIHGQITWYSPNDGAGIYVHPSVNIRISGCRFSGIGRFPIYFNGSPTDPPDYAIVEGCSFDSTTRRGIQSNKNICTTISNCTFANTGAHAASGSAISALGDLNVNACQFAMNGIDGDSSAKTITVTGCSFTKSESVSGGFGVTISANDTTLVSSCQFFSSQADGDHKGINQNSGTVFVKDCVFFNSEGTGGFGVVTQGGQSTITNCQFYVDDSYCIKATTDNVVRMRVSGCDFTGGNSTPILGGVDTINDWLIGGDNLFATGVNPVGKIGFDFRANMTLRPGINPAVTSSASTLTINANYNVHRISGTHAVSNVYVYGTAIENKCFSGPLRLLATGAWTLSAGGNIRRTAGLPHTVAANEVVEFLINPFDNTVVSL